MHTGNFSTPASVSYITSGGRGSSQCMETVQESVLEVGQVMVRPEAVSEIQRCCRLWKSGYPRILKWDSL